MVRPREREEMNRIWMPQAIITCMLLWAIYPENPYGYYILLRWVCCAVFSYLAVHAFAQDKTGWVWVLGVSAAVYNPIVPLHLTRLIWSIVNVASIGIAAASVAVLRTDKLKGTRA